MATVLRLLLQGLVAGAQMLHSKLVALVTFHYEDAGNFRFAKHADCIVSVQRRMFRRTHRIKKLNLHFLSVRGLRGGLIGS